MAFCLDSYRDFHLEQNLPRISATRSSVPSVTCASPGSENVARRSVVWRDERRRTAGCGSFGTAGSGRNTEEFPVSLAIVLARLFEMVENVKNSTIGNKMVTLLESPIGICFFGKPVWPWRLTPGNFSRMSLEKGPSKI